MWSAVKSVLRTLSVTGANLAARPPIWLLWALTKGRFHHDDKNDCLVLVIGRNSWFYQRWYKGWGGTTLGPGVIMMVDDQLDKQVYKHELVHTEQYESAAIACTIFGLVCLKFSVPLGLAIYAAGPACIMGSSYLSSWLRGNRLYQDSEIERAARAVSAVEYQADK